MINFHLIVFLDYQNPCLATKIVSLRCFQIYDIFNIYSLIMLIYAN